MLKKQNLSSNGQPLPYSSVYAISDYQLSHLEGRLLTLIESWGMKDTQEKSVKDLVRKELWDLVQPCFIISAEDHTALRFKYQEEGRGQTVSTVPGIN